MSQQLFARTGWAGKAVATNSGRIGNLALPFDLDDEAHDDLVIKADVPKALRKAIEGGLPIISHDCVKENAERIRQAPRQRKHYGRQVGGSTKNSCYGLRKVFAYCE